MLKTKDHLWLHSELTGEVINAAMEVHRTLGPGYLETIYQQALILELKSRNFEVHSENEFTILYKGSLVGKQRLDIVVNRTVIVELKAVVGEMSDVFKAQTISYLKATGLEVALLINFGNVSLDVKRLVRYKDY